MPLICVCSPETLADRFVGRGRVEADCDRAGLASDDLWDGNLSKFAPNEKSLSPAARRRDRKARFRHGGRVDYASLRRTNRDMPIKPGGHILLWSTDGSPARWWQDLLMHPIEAIPAFGQTNEMVLPQHPNSTLAEAGHW
jgi:hypothetical protein